MESMEDHFSDMTEDMIPLDAHNNSFLGLDCSRSPDYKSRLSNGSPRGTIQEANAKEKFLSSHKQLQEAKQKLEELRLLRFEEKSHLKQEIEQLNEKYDVEERNSSNLEKQLMKNSSDKMMLDQKISDLEREQTIGTQINMMQEQEIVRLEMRLKDEEMQRYDISKQLDQLRKAIIEKDKIRMKQQSEMFLLKERVSQLDESNNYYKDAADESQQKGWDIEAKNHSLSDDVITLRSDLEDAKTEVSRLSLELKHSEMKTAHLEEDAGNAQKDILDIQANLESQLARCESSEEEHRKREILLQQEIDHATFNESKLKEKCEQNERSFHETRREKDEQIFDLKRIADRVPTLEEQIGEVETQKSETEVLLNELRDAIGQHIRNQDEDTASDISEHSSPRKLKVTSEDVVTPEEIEQYFKQADSTMRSLKDQIINLSQQVEQEQSMMADLSTTIGSLRNELGRAQTNLTNNVKIKENVQDQYQQANEKIRLQEKNMERKNRENEHLRELIQDYERQIEKLNTDLDSANTQMLHNTATHKEEEIQLQLIAQGLEKDIQQIETSRITQEHKHTDEADSLKLIIDDQNKTIDDQNIAIEIQNKEMRDLKAEMDNLIEDNKNLAQRLIHLESYSNKLSEMLDKNQTADDKAREKSQNEIKEYKANASVREAEVINLTRKVNDLTENIRDRTENLEQLDKKIKALLNSQKESENQKAEVRKEKGELERKLKSVSDAHLTAEKSVVKQSEENQSLNKTCIEQQKIIGELNEKIKLLDNEKSSMKDTVATMERGIRLKESLIAELSRKSGETNENLANLKSNVHKAENDKRLAENKLNMFRHEKSILEKQHREHDDEKTYLRDQVSNLQRLLAKAEDEKEVSLGNLAHYQNQLETGPSIKDKGMLKELDSQIQSLRLELNLERQRRERLEARYLKRDDQVSQLRSTFDHSLNTISNDTKNIKSLIGKSLQKIGRIQDNEATDSDVVETDSEAIVTPNTKLNTSKYLSLPSHHRSKSLECSVGTLGDKIKGGSTPRRYKYGDTPKSSPVSASGKSLSLIQETPVRDALASYRKPTKRLTR